MTLIKRFGWPTILREAEGVAGGAGETPAVTPPVTPDASILFPNETKSAAEGGEPPKSAEPPAGDWKEYQDDPSKSAEENARLKAEHDKTKPADKDDPGSKVPEDGKYDLKMPDGIELDAELANALGPEFKELNLTNAQAQKLVDKYIAIQQERAETATKSWGETVSKWADDAKADKEIGGANWDTSVQNAHRFMATYGTPGLKEYLNASGGGNHPEVIRIFAKAGALIREDNPAQGGSEGRGKPADPAHILFPNDAPKGN